MKLPCVTPLGPSPAPNSEGLSKKSDECCLFGRASFILLEIFTRAMRCKILFVLPGSLPVYEFLNGDSLSTSLLMPCFYKS